MNRIHPWHLFGQEPAPVLLEWLRCLAVGSAPSAAARAMLDKVAAETAAGRDSPARRLLPGWRAHPAFASLPDAVRAVVEREFRTTAGRFLAFERQVLTLAAAFQPADIPLILLKGFPLAHGVYAHPGYRPMGDLDIAVPPDRFADAAAILTGLGYVERQQEGHVGQEVAGVNTHAITFRHPTAALSIDLHYHVCSLSRWAGADDGFWAHRQPLGLRAANCFALSDADQLLHTCLHGLTPSFRQPAARWMLDAHRLLTRRPNLDWAQVLAAADRHRCGPVLASCLDYLVSTLDAPVPAGIIDQLRRGRARPYDIGFFRLSAAVVRRPGLYRRAARRWYEGQRQADHRFTGFGEFLRTVAEPWGVTDLAGLLGQIRQRWREPLWLRQKRQGGPGVDP